MSPSDDLAGLYARIDGLLAQRQLNRTELLRRLDVPTPHRAAYNWWSGQRPKILQHLPAIAAELGVNAAWLRSGASSHDGAIAVIASLGIAPGGSRIDRTALTARSLPLPAKPVALQVEVTLWTPFAGPGDLVLIDPASTVDPSRGNSSGMSSLDGHIVLVETTQDGWFLARCASANVPRGFLLAAIDPRHPTPLPLAEVVIGLTAVVGVLQGTARNGS